MKRIKVRKIISKGTIALLSFVFLSGGVFLPNNFVDSIQIGSTTYDEVLKADPSTKAVITSYGYITFHELEDGTQVSIKFAYNDGDFIATSISTALNN